MTKAGNGRQKERYNSDPEYREKVLAYNRAHRTRGRDAINEKRRARWREDDGYRKRQLEIKAASLKRSGDFRQRNAQLKYRYGITAEKYNEIAAQQNNACAICGERPERLHLDHCHKSNKVRALLCNGCNVGLGAFRDRPELLSKAIAYLVNHNVTD